MTRARPALSWTAPLLVTLLALAALGWVVRADVRKAWMEWRAQQPLAEQAQVQLQQCTDPGWSALVSVLLQDLEVDCGAAFLGAAGAGHLKRGRVRWTREIAEDPSMAPRIRLRAATWLLLAGEPPPRGLAVVALDGQLDPVTLDAFLDALATREEALAWLPPTLADELLVRRLEQGEWDRLLAVAELLRRQAVARGSGDAAFRERTARAVLDGLGLPPAELTAQIQRRRQGLPMDDLPEPMRRVLETGNPCGEDIAGAACLRQVAALADAERELMGSGFDGGPEGAPDEVAPAPYTALEPLLEALYGHEARGVVSAAQWLGLHVRWLSAAPDELQRAGWLLGLVSHPHPRYAGAGQGDPLTVLRQGGGSPWNVAAVAMVLGEETGVPVDVWPREAGLVLRIGPYTSAVGACGRRLPPGVPTTPSLPLSTVLALSALEAAQAERDPAREARLAWMAGRLDPVFEREAPVPASVGGLLGAQLRAPRATAGPGRQAVVRTRLAGLEPFTCEGVSLE